MNNTTTDRLFVYGTLGPGRPNEHILANIGGDWQAGRVHGFLKQEGWGAEMGYPGIIPNNRAPLVEGFVFTSDALSNHWQTLDQFEADAYCRQPVTVLLDDGTTITASIYALRQER